MAFHILPLRLSEESSFLEGREIKEVLVVGRVDFERCNNEIVFDKPISIESSLKLTL